MQNARVDLQCAVAYLRVCRLIDTRADDAHAHVGVLASSYRLKLMAEEIADQTFGPLARAMREISELL